VATLLFDLHERVNQISELRIAPADRADRRSKLLDGRFLRLLLGCFETPFHFRRKSCALQSGTPLSDACIRRKGRNRIGGGSAQRTCATRSNTRHKVSHWTAPR
jgi:hypothetical protein